MVAVFILGLLEVYRFPVPFDTRRFFFGLMIESFRFISAYGLSCGTFSLVCISRWLQFPLVFFLTVDFPKSGLPRTMVNTQSRKWPICACLSRLCAVDDLTPHFSLAWARP
jgi:hypothetical protein